MSTTRILALPLLAAAAGLLVACDDRDRDGQEVAAVEPMTGEELYVHWCADCHNPGPGHPGTLRMAARIEGDEASLVNRANDAQTVRFAVRNGFLMMPPFRMTEISDEELERLVDYLSEPRP